jgi:hypothetical protein
MPTHSGEEEGYHPNIGSQRIAICICNVKNEIKPPLWGGKLRKRMYCAPRWSFFAQEYDNTLVISTA